MAKPQGGVGAFIAALPAPSQALVARLRSVILEAEPGLTEQIKWNAPSFCVDGDDRLTMRLPPKGGLQLIFHRGAKVKDAAGFQFSDPAGLLAWPAKDRGVLTFADLADLDTKTPAVADLARRWIAATR